MTMFLINTSSGVVLTKEDNHLSKVITSKEMVNNINKGIYAKTIVYPATVQHLGYLLTEMNALLKSTDASVKGRTHLINLRKAERTIKDLLSQVEPLHAKKPAILADGSISFNCGDELVDEVLAEQQIVAQLLLSNVNVPFRYTVRYMEFVISKLDCEIDGLCELLPHVTTLELEYGIRDDITRLTLIKNNVTFSLAKLKREIKQATNADV